MKKRKSGGRSKPEERRVQRPPADIARLLPLYQIGGRGYFGYRMVLAARLFDRKIILLLQECGPLSLPQWRVLAQLGLIPFGTVRTLAEGAAVDRAEVSRAIRELSTQGLIRREESQLDQRSPVFSLTPKGKKLFVRIRKPISEFIEHLVDDIAPADLEAADRVLWAVTRGAAVQTE